MTPIESNVVGDGTNAVGVAHRGTTEFLNDQSHRFTLVRPEPTNLRSSWPKSLLKSKNGSDSAKLPLRVKPLPGADAFVKTFAVITIIALILGALSTLVFSLTSNNASDATTTTSAVDSSTVCPEADGSSERRIDFTAGFGRCLDFSKQYNATFDTSEGTIVAALDMAKTPETANNFAALAGFHYYDATQLFRTDTTIDIIQGGSPHSQNGADSGPGYTLRDEGAGFKYLPGDSGHGAQ